MRLGLLRSLVFLALITAAIFAIGARGPAATFTGLGDLPGGGYGSSASAVSGDGSVVVGHSTSGSGVEAFRWTASGGMVGLGALPGRTFYSSAFDVSADGSVVVGESTGYV